MKIGKEVGYAYSHATITITTEKMKIAGV